MSQETIIPNTEVSFKDFLLKNKRNRTLLLISAAAILIQFTLFKYFYPFASYIHGDSFVYIQSAMQNLSINTYLIGYSMFLRLFSIFSTSDTALVGCQYLLLQGSSLFLLFTLFHFHTPGRVVQTILICFMVFNPLFLYMANMVSSDALFAALSLTWMASLLWIIHRPSLKLILWHVVLIFAVFTVRYNALIYVFISAVAFALSQQSVFRKIAGIAGGAFAVAAFVIHTGHEYKRLTGTWQYSPFAGWQMTNNAMYAYRYVPKFNRKPVPKRFESLDSMIRTYFDNTRDTTKFPVEKVLAGTYYMWSPALPLFKYRDSIVFKNDSISSELKKWATMGPLYKAYGLLLMRQYPGYFARYFLWPNAIKYYTPPIEFLASYNSGKNNIYPSAQAWFRYSNLLVKTRFQNLDINTLNFYPILSGVINVVMLSSLLGFLFLGGLKQKEKLRKTVILGITVWLLNAAFTIFASSVALRFQAFPILVSTVYVGLLVDWIAKKASTNQGMYSSLTTTLSTVAAS